jgi:PPK2 family polyphosphate:nucleotide phosphotransferase
MSPNWLTQNLTCPLMRFAKIARHCRIDKPDKFRLSDHNPADCFGLDIHKDEPTVMLADGIKRLTGLQERLYAQHRWAVLVIFQGMDAAGKDSAIKHVMSGVNPQGCEVHSFKAPSAEDLAHDFLWRCVVRLPERGRIGIFNRSYYEEVLVVRVHPDKLALENLPLSRMTNHLWEERFNGIRSFERHLARNGTLILKFFLNISKEEQRRRLLVRIEEPRKQWKFSMDDVAERQRWAAHMAAYEDMIRATSQPEAPWYVVPADNKLFTRLVVASTIVSAMDKLDLAFPKLEGDALKQLEEARRALINEVQPAPRPKIAAVKTSALSTG